ncbi:Protein AraJ precursor [Snodgrassella alvi wkB2]|uniref:MFS transporter n=1 Tax=Snodgrassella alvi TaxID=1196083 RepID=A0ABD7Z374_9NEIS|nr:MFS transporter [Snodgrassella alvi]AHN27684.1 Protein AraJ precursor [Snodgrassella alvi wkB2]PIT43230.1 MFS transporter AraJ [Snodgrassella alvi]UOO99137.1 MFS transporter [Snodgrassella alvi wkB2]WLS99001.1 MFS transporter [Snodgrassella alvi]
MLLKSLLSLSLGTFALGMAEFSMMGILPDVAVSLNISIAQAGHFIAAYAIGVCCGAWLLVLSYRLPPKTILLSLSALIAIGNILAALSPGYMTLLVARFISGLPHGAYFGIGSIVATKLAPPGRSAQAVALMIAGMTVANLIGVPVGTWLSLHLSWRLVFTLVAVVAIILVFTLRRFIPQMDRLPDTGILGQFRFLKSAAPWLILAATMFGNGGIFCWFSYISPLLTQVSGFSGNQVSLLMVLAGAGMVAGNWCGGRLADRYTPGQVAAGLQGLAAAALLLIFLFASNSWLSAILMCVCTFCLFAVSAPQQLLLLRHSPGGALLGAASVQMAFNLGNAIGSYNGGLAISHHWGYQYPALLGVPLTLIGCACLLWFHRRYENLGQDI